MAAGSIREAILNPLIEGRSLKVARSNPLWMLNVFRISNSECETTSRHNAAGLIARGPALRGAL